MNRRILIPVAVAAVIAVALIAYALSASDGTRSARYTPALDSSANATSTVDSSETTAGALGDPLSREMEGEEVPESFAQSIRSRSAGSGDGSSATPSDSDDSGDPAATPGSPSQETPPPPVTRLSLAERQAFFWEMIEAEDRAVFEADAEYPMDADPPQVAEYVALMIELTEEYTTAVRDAYGVTLAEADSIIAEGIANRWPMPPLPE